MIHTFWLVQGTVAKNNYSTNAFNDKHNAVLNDWQTVDKLLTYCGEVNLVKCNDGYFTKSVVTKAMTVAKPYYTATKPAIEVKEVQPIPVKSSKSIIWNQLKSLGYDSKQLKANHNVSYQSASKELLESILEQLQKEVGGGVDESLGEVDGGSLQPNSLITDTINSNQDEVNSSEVKKLTPKQLRQRFTDSDIYCEKLGSKYQIQFNASSNNPSKIYTYSVNNYALIDLAEKFEIVTADEVKAYRNNDNRCYKVSEPVNLVVLKEEKTANPDMSPESLLWHCVDKYGWKADEAFEVVYSLFDPQSAATINSSETLVNYIVTLADYPQVVIKDDYNPKELTEVTEEQLLGSLYTDKVTAEMMFPGSYYTVMQVNPVNIHQQLMQHYNLETTSTIVATETSDNITEFKGIPVEHFETMEDAWYSTFGNTNSDYLVIDLMTDYPGIVAFENISNEYTHSSILNTVTELKQYVGYSETYRGIEFTHSTKHNYTGYVDLLPGTVELKLGHYNFVKLATKKSLTAFEVSTMLDAVKQANEWLGVNTVKVPSTEEAIQPSPLEHKSIYA